MNNWFNRLNKLLKDKLRQKWTSWIISYLVKKVWNEICEETILKLFLNIIFNGFDGTEYDAICDDDELLLLQTMGTVRKKTF